LLLTSTWHNLLSMVPSGTLFGVAARTDLTTTQRDFIEEMMERVEWWTM
jgi:hypothetical protein